MSTDPRIVIRDVLNDWIIGPDTVDAGADSILADLAKAGFVLLPPGGETRTEWGVEFELPTGVKGITPTIHQASGEDLIGVAKRWGQPGTRRVVSRTVYTGPWQPVGGEDR